MSKEIDERVAELRLENSNFEQNAKTSIGTLGKLEAALDLSGAAKGFQEINNESKRFDFSPLSNGVETVKAKFSALEVMAVTALANITNSAVNAGKKLVSSFTIEPIKTGLAEYETQINAVQTILANTKSKGTTLDNVNSALDELNAYADKTIYNFTEMTRNIGTFTAAGVELDTSVQAIKGIANLAAVSGSTSQQASTAMYQLSQALSSGTVKLQDWNSVVNAGMGGQVFQDSLKETARAHGIAIDEMIESEGSFRETLKEGWLSSEILTETLSKFTGDLSKEQLKSMGYTDEQIEGILELGETANDAATKVKTFTQLMDTLKEAAQSGWTQTWEILVGDFEEAKELWTTVSDVFGKIIQSSSDARNNMLQGWSDLGGRAALIESLQNAFKGLVSIVKPIKEAFSEIFPPVTSEQLFKFTEGLRDLTAKFTLSAKHTEQVKTAFKGLFSIIEIAFKATTELAKGFAPVVGFVSQALTKCVSVLGGWIDKLRIAIDESGVFGIISEKLGTAFGKLGEKISSAMSSISGKFKAKPIVNELDAVSDATSKLGEFFARVFNADLFSGTSILEEALNRIRDLFDSIAQKKKEAFETKSNKKDGFSFEKVLDTLKKIGDHIKAAADKVKEYLSGVGDTFYEAVQSGGLKGVIDVINGGLTTAVLLSANHAFTKGLDSISKSLSTSIKSLSDMFKGVKGSFDGIANVLNGVKGCLAAYQKDLNANVLLKIAGSVAILTASIALLAMIDADKLGKAVIALTGIIADLSAVLIVFNKLGMNIKGATQSILIMNGLATSVLILSGALLKLASLSWEGIAKGLTGVFGLMAMVVAATYALSKIEKKAMRGAANIVIFSVALKQLASSCSDLAKLSWEELAKGLTGILGLTGIITAAAFALSKIDKRVMSGATNIVIFSSALKILTSVCIDLANLSWNGLAKGLVGVGVLLAELDVFLNTAKFGGMTLSTASAIAALAGSLKIMSSVCDVFAQMDWDEVVRGLTGVAVLLAEVGVFAAVVGKTKFSVSSGIALTILGGAISAIADSVSEFAKLSWEGVVKGLSGLAVALAAVVTAVRLMPSNLITIGAGLTEVSFALVLLADAMRILGDLSWMAIAKGMVALGGAVAVMAVGLLAMNNTIKGSVALSTAAGALLVIAPVISHLSGLSFAKVATGLGALAATFIVLGTAAKILRPLAGTMIKVSAAITIFGAGITLVGTGLIVAAAGLTAFATSLVLAAASVGEIISTICIAIVNSADSIADALSALIVIVGSSIRNNTTFIAETLLGLISDTLDIVKSNVPQIVDTICDIVLQILDSLTQKLPTIVTSAADCVRVFIDSLNSALGNGSWEKLILSITALSSVFLALAGAAKLISTINIKGAVKGIAGFTIVVAGLSVLLAALGGLAQIPGLDWIIGEGSRILIGIGYSLGALVGSLVNGLVTNMPSDLEQFLTVMTEVGAMIAALEPLSSIISEIDFKGAAKGMAGVGIMVGGLTTLLAALGGLNQIPGFEWIISEGSKVLGMLGTAIGNAVGSIVQGLTDAVTSDTMEVLSDIASVASVIGATAGVGKILSTLKLDPVAVAKSGAAVAVLIGEVAAVLAILGGLKQIPGFDWIMSEGSQVLAQIGYAIGDFVGSIVGGLGAGITSGLPAMGDNLSAFMTSVQPFLDGAKNIDDTVMKGILSLSAAILCITAADLISGITSFLTGGSSIAKFGEEIAAFGPYIKQFSDSVAGVNNENVVAAANAAKALADMADTVPNEGGVAAWFAGENSVSKFGADIASFGKDLKTFSDNVTGINPENIQAAANAGKALAEMAETIPNEGGVAAWFAGENSVSKFGADIESFGTNLSNFSMNAQNVNPERVIAAANAAKTLAEMANAIPNTGGMASWFAGENSVAAFGTEIEKFGTNLSNFSVNASSVDPERVTAAANAAKTLAEMANMVPNEGGMASWFAGENNVAKFGADIESFGTNLSNFSNNAKSVDPPKVTAAATAAKSLVEIANSIPNTGGVASWFAGDNNIAAFGADIESFGTNMSNFSKNANSVEPSKVTAAAEAAKTLISIANTIPNTGGVASWFAGDNNIAAFGADIESFGTNISTFSVNANNVNPETVTAAATAAKSLIEIANMVPDTGGVVSWFAGDNSLSKFGSDIASFGTSLNSFSKNVTGISPDNVTAAAQAGKTLAELTSTVPNSGGVKAWFTGEQSLSKFGGQIADFGKHIKSFSNNVTGLDVAAVSAASEAGKTLVGMTNTIPQTVNVEGFGKGIVDIAKKISEFTKIMTGLNVSGSVSQVNQIISMVKNIQNANIASLTTLGNALQSVASEGVSKFVKAFDDSATKVKNAIANLLNKAIETITNTKTDFYNSGKTILGKFVDGVKAQETYAKNTFSSIVNACLTILKNKFFEFENTGRTTMFRFISGVNSQSSSASSAFAIIITACLNVIKGKYIEFEESGKSTITMFINGIKNNSSSVSGYFTSGLSEAVSGIRAYHEQFYGAGEYLVDGFVNGIKDNIYYAKEAAKKMAQESSKAAKDALDINSPSKVFYQIGEYSGMSFVNALDDYGQESYKSGKQMANYAKQGLATAISKISKIVEDGIDTQPTIRPVLDLSEVKLGARNLDAILSHEQAITIGASINSANSGNIQNEPNPVANGGVTFVQNNYSPKALSRVEIYRQTNNQISRMRGLSRT